MLIAPKKLSVLIENLKRLVDSQYDAQFKLTQQQEPDGSKKQYLEIQAASVGAQNSFRVNVEIATIFTTHLYPSNFEPKQVRFTLDTQTCQLVFSKFANRL